MKFDLEILRFLEQDKLLYIKFKQTDGLEDDYKNITSRIVQTIKNI